MKLNIFETKGNSPYRENTMLRTIADVILDMNVTQKVHIESIENPLGKTGFASWRTCINQIGNEYNRKFATRKAPFGGLYVIRVA